MSGVEVGRRGYPDELRQRALDMVARGRSVYLVATELGISVQVIYRWRALERAQQASNQRALE